MFSGHVCCHSERLSSICFSGNKTAAINLIHDRHQLNK